MPNSNTAKFQDLKKLRDAEWDKIIKSSEWSKFILNGEFDRTFYAIYLIETYHYVKHNPKHQALVGTRLDEMPTQYNKFCYEHAEEETGHEMMAYHDLINLGVTDENFQMPKPLNSTEVFISYLYKISSTGNIFRRLGYSFWAEDSYQYIQSLVDSVVSTLELDKKHTTFLVSHASIDEDHAAEIDEMISRFCTSEDTWLALEDVLKTSLMLQSKMLDDVVHEYKNLKAGQDSRYSFLKN